MSSALADCIMTEQVEPGTLAIYWLSQAGFVFKSSDGKIVYVDPYFSNVVERMFGFKRMMSCPIAPEEVNADLIVCTHEHLDHMDIDALPIVARNPQTKFAGPIECVKAFEGMGIPPERCLLLEQGNHLELDGISIHTVFADHGDLAPDAVGIVLEMNGLRVYHTGDTAYRPAQFQGAVDLRPHVLLPCINGRYGNLDALEAAQITKLVNPQLVIASHFWMFVEHDGDPAGFLEACSRLAPTVECLVMKPGEKYSFVLRRPDPVASNQGGK